MNSVSLCRQTPSINELSPFISCRYHVDDFQEVILAFIDMDKAFDDYTRKLRYIIDAELPGVLQAIKVHLFTL